MDIVIHLPNLWVFLDKLSHHLLAFLVIKHNDLNASLLKVFLSSHKSSILAYNDPLDFVKEAGSSAHVTWRKGSVHGCTFISGSREPARIFKG